jgi:probable F420-dependent oxidoreductase
VTLRFIFQYPETTGSDADMLRAGPVDEVAAAAERAGFSGFAFTDHPIPGNRWLHAGGHQSLDPFVALGFAAAATERLRLLTYLAVAPYRNPSILAKAAATVDKLSGGRFILGVGVGYNKSEYRALGVDFDERNALFEEALDVLPLHWKGEPFSYEGRHFSARDVIARPIPVQDPIPIWIGGNAKVTRRRVAERAQGWMPMVGSPELSATARTPVVSTPAQVAEMLDEIREAAGAAGRTDDLDCLYAYFPSGSVLDEPERHREAFAEIEAAGATWAAISAPSTELGETVDFLEGFGATYLEPAGG